MMLTCNLQCARRWLDEGHKSHLVNLGKYVSAMLAAGAKVAYEKEKNVGWLCLVVVMSSAATVYQLYWDFVKDWGLLQLHSNNPWLRNELMLRQKFIYYFSMVLKTNQIEPELFIMFEQKYCHNTTKILENKLKTWYGFCRD